MKARLTEQTGELVALVREGRLPTVVDRALHLPSADLADVLVELRASERRALVMALPPGVAAPALRDLPRDARPERILVEVGAERAAALVGALDDDDATSLLARLGPAERRAVLDAIADPQALDQLLAHAGNSAGGLMTSRLVSISELDPIALAIEEVRRQAAAIGDLSEIFVIDAERRLRGVLALRQLLVAPGSLAVRDAMTPHPVHVGPDEDRPVVARVITRYGLTSVPVIDRAGRLLGRVTADAVRDVTVDEAADDLLRFGGVSVGEPLDATWSAVVRSRLPWLYAYLVPAFGAAAVVYLFKGTLLRIITLAVWMPVVGGVGGNGGTQALAASVRRLVLQPARSPRLRPLIVREAATGIGSGLALGVVVGSVAVLLGESWRLGLVVAMAMTANLALAAMLGAAVPVLLRRLGRDPSLASPVMVTALLDATGFALLLGLASLVLL